MKKSKASESNRFLDDLTDGFEAIQQYVRGERELRVTTLQRDATPESATDSSSTTTPYVVLFEEGPRGWAAVVPDLPGCVASGPTMEEVEVKIEREMQWYLQAARKAGRSLPTVVTRAKVLSVVG